MNKLATYLHTVFPQYLDIFSDVCSITSILILKQYGTPDKILRGHKNVMIAKISKASRKGLLFATERYEQLIAVASAAKIFGCDIDSVYFNISLTINLITGVGFLSAITIMCEIGDFSVFKKPK